MEKAKSNVGKLKLTCKQNETLNILGAYFGIQKETLTSCTSGQSSSVCFNKVVYDNVNSTCGGEHECTLLVSIDRLGDPCLLQNKQFFVKYQCVDSRFSGLQNKCNINKDEGKICQSSQSPNSEKLLSKYWCDYDDSMYIDCGSKRIDISCAYYGIDSLFRCNGGFYSGAPTMCYSSSSYTNITNKCNGQSKCSVVSSEWSEFFKIDPCYAMTK